MVMGKNIALENVLAKRWAELVIGRVLGYNLDCDWLMDMLWWLWYG